MALLDLPSGKQIAAGVVMTVLTVAILKAAGGAFPRLRSLPFVGAAF